MLTLFLLYLYIISTLSLNDLDLVSALSLLDPAEVQISIQSIAKMCQLCKYPAEFYTNPYYFANLCRQNLWHPTWKNNSCRYCQTSPVPGDICRPRPDICSIWSHLTVDLAELQISQPKPQKRDSSETSSKSLWKSVVFCRSLRKHLWNPADADRAWPIPHEIQYNIIYYVM